MSTSPKSKTPQHLCCVTIDFHSLLLPADKGLKLVDLLRGAVLVRRAYDDGRVYEIGEEVEVDYETVKASQVRTPRLKPAPADTGQLQISHAPKRLTRG